MPMTSATKLEAATNPQEAIVAFVRALAKRQARIDAGLTPPLAANDNEPPVMD